MHCCGTSSVTGHLVLVRGEFHEDRWRLASGVAPAAAKRLSLPLGTGVSVSVVNLFRFGIRKLGV